jgi:four helix bundle protein
VPTIRRFEDIEAWQKARVLVREIYLASDSGAFARDYGLRDQIRRASVSIMSNIAEGFDRGGTVEFAQYLAIAKGSAGEVKAQLYVALDQGYIKQDNFDRLVAITDETSRMLKGLMAYLRKTSIKGSKFKS